VDARSPTAGSKAEIHGAKTGFKLHAVGPGAGDDMLALPRTCGTATLAHLVEVLKNRPPAAIVPATLVETGDVNLLIAPVALQLRLGDGAQAPRQELMDPAEAR
jgi:hypothetical protein